MDVNRLRGATQWMVGQRSATIDSLIRWCDQNSWSLDRANLDVMSTMLEDDFDQVGITLDRLPLPDLKLLGDSDQWIRQPTGPLLVWHHNPESLRRLLLMIHYDTVYPAGSLPCRCRRVGQHLIGPGTADAKGGIAVIRLAVQSILKFGFAADVGLTILLNPDEEIGSTASSGIMESMCIGFERALVFEPTLPDGSMVAARKGSGNFAFIVRGRSAHAGRDPEAGRNAIVHLAKLIPTIAAMHDPQNGVLVNVGRVVGGGPLNRVPDHASVQLNVRVSDPAAMRRVSQTLDRIATDFTFDQYRVTVRGEFHSPPKLVTDAIRAMQTDVERAARASGRSIRWKDTGGACDGSKLAALGLPNIDTMGVSGGGLHGPEEFCDVDSIVPAAVMVVAMVADWAAEPFSA